MAKLETEKRRGRGIVPGLKPKKCEYEKCGKIFVPARPGQRFCDPKCNHEFYYEERRRALAKFRREKDDSGND